MSISSYESDVAYDDENIFDMTIDATSTACLNIVDLMMKGTNCGAKNSNIMSKFTVLFSVPVFSLGTGLITILFAFFRILVKGI